MLQKLLNKLIRSSASQTKYLMALMGLSVAIVLILSAVQLQANFYELLNGKTIKTVLQTFWLLIKRLPMKMLVQVGCQTLQLLI